MEYEELEKLEELEEEEATNQAGDYAGDEATKNKNQKGGAGMRVRRKRNIEGMLERLKRLQKALKESQRMYFIELGKTVLRWYQEGYKQGRAGAKELEEELRAVAETFGKSLDEPVE